MCLYLNLYTVMSVCLSACCVVGVCVHKLTRVSEMDVFGDGLKRQRRHSLIA